MTEREALKLALETLEDLMYWDNGKPEFHEASKKIIAIKEALAQQEQKLVSLLLEQKKTDKWESARVADYNSGWNDCRKTMLASATKPAPCNCKTQQLEQEPVPTSDTSEKRVDETVKQRHEPVAYGMWDTMLGKENRMMMVRLDKGQDGCTVPLYTPPPQRIWQGLTEEEREKIYDTFEPYADLKAIEAKLKEKNGYDEEKNT